MTIAVTVIAVPIRAEDHRKWPARGLFTPPRRAYLALWTDHPRVGEDKTMALLDKVKSQAKDLKQKVEGKVEDVQDKRKADDLLDDLGRILFAERTGRPMDDAES